MLSTWFALEKQFRGQLTPREVHFTKTTKYFTVFIENLTLSLNKHKTINCEIVYYIKL